MQKFDGKTRTKFRRAIYQIWRFYDIDRRHVTKKARVERGIYQCEKCGALVGAKEIDIDHVKPVGPMPGSRNNPDGDWNDWLNRLFCGADNLQALCKGCHREKTAS